MSSERLRRLGWRPRVDLASGLQRAYADFLHHQAQAA
jgi:nucleoside-diphosphate-sugar epimerase